MAKQSGQKLRLLYLYRIMLEQTDTDHGITLARIAQELNKYGICAERKTLYDDIESLRLYGLDIQVYRSRGVKYCLCTRKLSRLQVKLIDDAISRSDIIPARDREQIRQKLILLSGKNSLPLLTAQKADDDNFKRELFLNLDLLCEAMVNGKQVSCRCFCWNSHKQRIMRFDGEKIILSPLKLDTSKTPLLVAYDHKRKSVLTLEVEKLIDIEILDSAKLSREELAAIEGDKVTYEQSDASVMMVFRCANRASDEVISYFGTGITVYGNTDEFFEFSARVYPCDELYAWLFLHASDIELISPEKIRSKYLERLEAASRVLKNK